MPAPLKWKGASLLFWGDPEPKNHPWLPTCGYVDTRSLLDDLTLRNPTLAGLTTVTPCAPWIKLWRDTTNCLGGETQEWEAIAGKDFKYRLPLPESAKSPASTLPLGGLFLLETGDAAIASLTHAAAVAKMMLHAYPILLVHQLGQNPALFRQCADILKHIPMWTFSRPWNLSEIDQGLDRLEAHIASLGSSKTSQVTGKYSPP